MKQNAWRVYREWKKGEYIHIDTVFFNDGIEAVEVRNSLVNHDGYAPDIIVKKERI
jgi:hypothetical protein